MSKQGSVTDQLDINTLLRVNSSVDCQRSRPVILTKPQKRAKPRANRQHYPNKTQYIPNRVRIRPLSLDSAIKLTLDESNYVALLYLSSQSNCLAIPLLPSPERANSVL